MGWAYTLGSSRDLGVHLNPQGSGSVGRQPGQVRSAGGDWPRGCPSFFLDEEGALTALSKSFGGVRRSAASPVANTRDSV